MRARKAAFLCAVLVACNGRGRAPDAPAPPATASSPQPIAAPSSAPGDRAAQRSGPAELATKSVPFPDAKGPVSLDYLAFDRVRGRVWVPVGDTGSVDIFDIAA